MQINMTMVLFGSLLAMGSVAFFMLIQLFSISVIMLGFILSFIIIFELGYTLCHLQIIMIACSDKILFQL